MEYPEQTYYPGVFPSLPDTGTRQLDYTWTNSPTPYTTVSFPLPAEPARICEHCARLSELLGDLIALLREATERMKEMQEKKEIDCPPYPYSIPGITWAPYPISPTDGNTTEGKNPIKVTYTCTLQ